MRLKWQALKKTSDSFGPYYTVAFTADDESIKTYVHNISNVKVGNVNYSSYSYGIWSLTYRESAYSKGAMLKLEIADAVSSTENTTIEITAKGYKPLAFTITPDGALVDESTPSEPENSGKPEVPATTFTLSRTYFDSSQKYLQLYFNESNYSDWLKNISEIDVNGKAWEKNVNTWYANGYGISSSWITGENSIAITANQLEAGDNIITVKANGYEDITWTIKKEDNGDFRDPEFTIVN